MRMAGINVLSIGSWSESQQIRPVSVFNMPVEENYGTHFSITIPFVQTAGKR